MKWGEREKKKEREGKEERGEVFKDTPARLLLL